MVLRNAEDQDNFKELVQNYRQGVTLSYATPVLDSADDDDDDDVANHNNNVHADDDDDDDDDGDAVDMDSHEYNVDAKKEL